VREFKLPDSVSAFASRPARFDASRAQSLLELADRCLARPGFGSRPAGSPSSPCSRSSCVMPGVRLRKCGLGEVYEAE
jgi:hypothetical protein